MKSLKIVVNAIENINARNIFIFPNNSNIIMAANQAKQLSDKNIVVIQIIKNNKKILVQLQVFLIK